MKHYEDLYEDKTCNFLPFSHFSSNFHYVKMTMAMTVMMMMMIHQRTLSRSRSKQRSRRVKGTEEVARRKSYTQEEEEPKKTKRKFGVSYNCSISPSEGWRETIFIT